MDAVGPAGTNLRYWLLVGVLVVLGLLTIFSVGLYFWFVAAALVILSPFRSNTRVFLSGLALALGFLFGYVLVAPWSCSQTMSATPNSDVTVTSPVVCTSPTGIEYSEDESGLVPALIAGGLTGLAAAAVTWALAKPRSGRRAASG